VSQSSGAPALPRLSVRDTIAVSVRAILPTFLKGLMIRRSGVVALSARFGLDDRAVAEVDRLRKAYGGGLVRLALPGRPQVVVLDGEDVLSILAGAPEPFSPSTQEKRATLGHFEPRASLISRGEERTVRRRLSDAVLEDQERTHSMAAPLLSVMREEAATFGDEFGWAELSAAWARAIRRTTLGDGARHDLALSRDLDALRRAGNWSFFHPRRPRLLRRHMERLTAHLARAEPGSLAARVAVRPEGRDERAAVADQVTHWLFAFDAAAITAARTLALLVAHPRELAAVRDEPADAPPGEAARLAIVETLRLYPTTPAILREATEEVEWRDGTIPAGSHLIIYAPAFHRDGRYPEAHRFEPAIWRTGGVAEHRPYIPFSFGPAECPGRHLVPMLAAEFVRAVVRRGTLRLSSGPRLGPTDPLPGTLNHTALRFAISPDPRRELPSADQVSEAAIKRSSSGDVKERASTCRAAPEGNHGKSLQVVPLPPGPPRPSRRSTSRRAGADDDSATKEVLAGEVAHRSAGRRHA